MDAIDLRHRHPALPKQTIEEKAEAFLSVWLDASTKRGGLVPRKPDFNIRNIKEFLPHYFLAEWDGEDLINRLVGTQLDVEMGAQLTGKSFFRRYKGEQRQYFQRLWRLVVEHPCGVLLGRTLPVDDCRSLQINAIDLPLADANGDVRYICGVATIDQRFCTHMDGRPASPVKIDFIRFLDLGFGLPKNTPSPPGGTPEV